MTLSRLVNRNIVAGSGRTSMRLEPELWNAVEEICERQGISLGELVRQAERSSGPESGRTSAVRVFALSYFRNAATEHGHEAAGHGRPASTSHANANGPQHANAISTR
jgi:predicted DNA-binding ribbon-helix-helix protein